MRQRAAARLGCFFILIGSAAFGQTATDAPKGGATSTQAVVQPVSSAPVKTPPATSTTTTVTTGTAAQDPPAVQKPAMPPATPPVTLAGVSVTGVLHYVQTDPDKGAHPPAAGSEKDYIHTHASLGDSIEIRGNDFKSLVRYAEENNKSISLYLNGNDTLTAPWIIDPEAGRLVFRLERNGNNKAVWSALLNKPYAPRVRTVLASVGMNGGSPVPAAKGAAFKLVVASWGWWASGWLVLLLLMLWWFLYLAGKKDLLRDGPTPAVGPKQAYSLGRTQMAWWFFLIIVGFVFIWLISGDQDTITASLLMLMGISSGTALGSRLVDTNGSSTPPPPSVTHGSWIKDILSDSTGTIVLHRFQVVIWTLVLGIMFVVTVFNSLSMPVFSETLVTLMGISSGTYLGFKLSEH
jgi:hypothetical protein